MLQISPSSPVENPAEIETEAFAAIAYPYTTATAAVAITVVAYYKSYCWTI